MESKAAEERGNGEAGSDKRGKYRIMAEIKSLEQDSKFLEEELDELERIQDVSAICDELLLDVEARPDALLPTTHGPVNPKWNRWFEGPQDPDGCRCRIVRLNHCRKPFFHMVSRSITFAFGDGHHVIVSFAILRNSLIDL